MSWDDCPRRVVSCRCRQLTSSRALVMLRGTLFEAGAMTQDQILEFCVASLANILRVPKDSIQIDAKFSRLGLDSAMTVYFQMELEDKLGLELSPDNFYDYPTVDRLSRHLSQLYGARSAA
jgi:acyl carrier protein